MRINVRKVGPFLALSCTAGGEYVAVFALYAIQQQCSPTLKKTPKS